MSRAAKLRADLISRCASDPLFLKLHARQLSSQQMRIVAYLRDHGTFTSWGWNANSPAEKDEALRLIHPPQNREIGPSGDRAIEERSSQAHESLQSETLSEVGL